MIAYKFLLPERRGVFSRVQWPLPGEWLRADGPLAECRNGIHACRPLQLPYWLGEELWEVELEGDTIQGRLKVVAPHGRLLRRVEEWNADTQRELGMMCLGRTAERAAAALDAAGLHTDLARLAATLDVAAIRAAATAASEQAHGPQARRLKHLVGYVSEAVEYLESAPPSVVAYIAAYSADVAATTTDFDAFAAEREVQGRWLLHRLSLAAEDSP
jgi:hypothetical protein